MKKNPNPPRTFLSLGAGLQSTTMLLALQAGDLTGPLPEAAIFADTGWEPQAVYDHVERLRCISRIPIVTVSLFPDRTLRDELIEAQTRTKKVFLDIPAFVRHGPKDIGMGKRQCTSRWKIIPIEREIRRRMNVPAITKWHPVQQYIGISWDEAERMRDNRNPNIENRYPLIDSRWTRQHCLEWLAKHHPDVQPSKSACIGCPFHSDDRWRGLTDEERADAIEVDEAIRVVDDEAQQFLHRFAIPLSEVLENMDRQPYLTGLTPESECGGYCFI